MRFLSTTCGILLLLGVLSSAQEPSLQNARRGARAQRGFPVQPASDPSPDAPPQTMPPIQQPLVRAPQNQSAAPPSAATDPAPAAPSPEQLPPPTPPEVTYRNGQLTVQAMNSTLASVLTAIRNKTGIQFEGLEGGGNERVVVSMGPASEGEVLAAIFGGSKYDYLVLDRPDSPGIVQRVLLSPRGGSPLGAGAQTAGLPGSRAQEDDEDVPDEQASSGEPEQPQDTPVRPPLTQAQQQPQPPQQPQTPQSTGPRTPEQLLEELRRMQQQQQPQAGQNQSPNKPPTVPQ